MTTAVILLILASFSVIVWEITFFRRERNQCQKYPLYKLRDDIVWHLATTDYTSDDIDVYERVNWAISRLRYFNFRFYAEVITQIIHGFIEDGYKCDFNPEQLKRQQKRIELPIFAARFVSLVLRTARTNSLLIRVSMTRSGYMALFAGNLPRAFARFRGNHPELFRRDYSRIETLQQFSMVNHLTQNA